MSRRGEQQKKDWVRERYGAIAAQAQGSSCRESACCEPAAFREIARVLKPGGRIAIADIVLDEELPQALRDNPDAYCSCISGAVGREEYLSGLRAASLSDVRVVAESDAAELLTSDCCGPSGADCCCGDELPELTGVVTSIHVTGRKAPSCCESNPPCE